MSNLIANEAVLINFLTQTQQQAALDRAQRTEEHLGFAKSGFFVGIFGFFTTVGGKALLMVKHLTKHAALQVFLFPIAGVLEIADATAAGVKLGKAKNKNLDKTMNFVSKTIPATIIVTAITLGITAFALNLAALGAVVPYLFVTALSINAAYHLSNTVYHAIKMCKAERGSALRAAHKKKLISNTITTVLDVLIVGVIFGLFVAAVSTPISLAVVASVGIVTLGTGVAISIFMQRYAKKQAKKIEERAKTAAAEEKCPLLTVNNNSAEANYDIKELTTAKGSEGDRLYVRNLATLLNAAKKIDTQNAMENKESNLLQQIFLKIITAKIENLTAENNADDKNANNRSSFFNMFTLNEKKKRKAKMDGLTALQENIEKFEKQTPINEVEINNIIKEKKRAGIFQSFWKDKSDVELIFDAGKKYFIHDINKDAELNPNKETDSNSNEPNNKTPLAFNTTS